MNKNIFEKRKRKFQKETWTFKACTTNGYQIHAYAPHKWASNPRAYPSCNKLSIEEKMKS